MEGIKFDILCDENIPEVLNMLRKLADKYQFDNGSFGIYSLPNSQVIGTTTLPMSWIQIYMQNAFFEHDPAVHVPLRANKPIDWKILEEFDTVGFFPLYYQEGHGNHGISIPLKGPHADVAVFTFSKNCETEEDWINHKKIVMEHLLADAVQMHAACLEIFDIKERFGIEPLDERQIQIVQGMASGKTAKDVAKAMNISPRTVEAQVRDVRRKLRAETTHQLMAKATALGLAHPQ
jgi:DNA-binding CsgD family transcriptional regulator